MKIAVIGTGNVGAALGTRWARNGHEVVYGSRDPASPRVKSLLKMTSPPMRALLAGDAAKDSDVIVLAIPWNSVRETIGAIGNMGGRVLIDATNPILPGMAGLEVGTTTSGAETIAQWTTGARVVKAFNTTGFNIMANPDMNGQAAAMFVAGDDAEARATVVDLSNELGFDTVDMGTLAAARYLEPMAMAWIHIAYVQAQGRDFAFSLSRR